MTRWLWYRLAGHRLLVLGWLAGVVLVSVTTALLPLLLGRAFDAAGRGGASAVSQLAAVLLLSQVARAVSAWAKMACVVTLAGWFEHEVREAAYRNAAARPHAWLTGAGAGEILTRLVNDVRQMRALLYPAGDAILSSYGFLLVVLVLAPARRWDLLLAPVLYTVGYVLIVRRLLRRLTGATDRVRASFGELNSTLGETLDGMHAVKVSGLEHERFDRFAAVARANADAVIAQGAVEARSPLLLLLGVTQAVGFGHILLVDRHAGTGAGAVVGYVGLLLMLGLPTFSAYTSYPAFAEGLAAARRVRGLMEEPVIPPAVGSHRAQVRGAIDLRDVDVIHRDGRVALRSVSATVPAGALVAVVGATGSGKSTLAALLNGVCAPTNGRVLLDGVDLRDWDPATLRAEVRIVPQEVMLLRGSITDNVTLGRQASTDDLRSAIRAGIADEFVARLPAGPATRLGPPTGVAVSGGQRQRLGVARALLRRPAVLVLDDSTHALDSTTERRLIESVRARTSEVVTVVVLTSRPWLAGLADRVLVLRRGSLVADGTPAEVAASGDPYARLFVKLPA